MGLPLEVISSNKSSIGESALIGNDTIVTTYVETLVCGRLSPRERLTDVMAILSGFAPFTPGYIKKISTALESGLRRRRLIITGAGSIGAAPEETQLSDLVCVLFDCSVPVVLRAIPHEDNYKFVGECYLHGFMDGEAVGGLEAGTDISQDFILK